MELSQKNLEQHGWLFSHSLRVMVREHELANNKWDVELDTYTNVGNEADPLYEPSPNEWFDSADTLAILITKNPELSKAKDWIHGDKVNFL